MFFFQFSDKACRDKNITERYELAIQYAKKTLEVETSMPYNKGVPSQGFIDRLNDLIAAKDYILSLKKK